MKKIFNSLKNVTKEFSITIVIILITTIINSIFMNTDIINKNLLENITTFCALLSIATFFIETVLKSYSKKKILLCILGTIISGVLTYLSNTKNEILEDFISRIICCYLITLSILSIYFNYKNSNKKFNEYVTDVFINLFKCSIIYGILSFGILIITLIFISLILNSFDNELINRLEILVLGCYYLPKIIDSFSSVKNDTSKFIIGVIKYVLEPLVIIAFIIIYIYILKILILNEIPSNQIFRILSSLFIIGCPIWTIGSSFKEKNILDKINNKLPYLFIPFVFLQIYSILVRIINNGLTESRYLCVMLIIFEIIYIIIYIIKKEKIEKVLFVIIILTIVSTIIPFINSHNVSLLSQYSNLKIYKQKENYTEKEKTKILGAYYYLNESEEGKKYINKLLSNEDIKDIKKINADNSMSDTKYQNYCIYSASYELDAINIENYKKMYIIRNNVTKNVDFKNIKFYVTSNSEKTFNLDLEKEINNYIINKDDFDNYFKNNYEIKIDSNRKLIIKNIYFKYYETDEKLENLSISGYLLEK